MKDLSSNTNAQQQRLRDELHLRPLTSVQIVNELDILRPSARIKELREHGCNIHTHRETVETALGVHKKVARYVLLSEGEHGQA